MGNLNIPSSSPSESLSDRSKVTREAHDAATRLRQETNLTPRAKPQTPEQQEREQLEADVRKLSQSLGLDLRLWKDESYDAKDVREQLPKIRLALEKVGQLPDGAFKLQLLQEIPVYINPSSIADSFRIKEGMHESTRIIALDPTEDIPDLLEDLGKGLDTYKRTVLTIHTPTTGKNRSNDFLYLPDAIYTLNYNNLGQQGHYITRFQMKPYRGIIDILRKNGTDVIATFSTDEKGKLVVVKQAPGIRISINTISHTIEGKPLNRIDLEETR